MGWEKPLMLTSRVTKRTLIGLSLVGKILPGDIIGENIMGLCTGAN
jgi:hypothetical protein